MKNSDYLTLKEVAEYFRVQPLTVRRWALAGQIPSHKAGEQWRFSLEEITAWAAREGRRGATKEILIVDDDKEIRNLFRRVLKAEGFLVREAGNGQEALDLIEKKLPSLIILDLDMPVLDGPDTLAMLQASHPDIPVIVVTSFGETVLMERALQYSPFTVINKPCNNAQLAATVKNLLSVK